VRPVLASLAILASLSGLGCRQLVGIEDIEPAPALSDAAPSDAAPRSDASHDAGACGCPGCTTLAFGLGLPTGLVRVRTDLYVTDYGLKPGEGALLRIPTAGGPVETVAAKLTHPSAIAADSRDIYWLDEDGKGHGVLEKRSASGGTTVALASGLGLVPELYMGLPQVPASLEIALTATDVYFVDFASNGTPGGIQVVSKGGGAVGTFVATTLADVGTASPVNTIAMVVDGNSIVLVDSNALFEGILEAPLPTGPVKVLGSNLAYPVNLAVAGNEIFFSSAGGLSGDTGAFQSISRSGGNPTTLVKGLTHPWAILVEDGFAYCSTLGQPRGGSIFKVSVDGGKEVALVTKAPQPFALASDSEHIYWVDPFCKTVMGVHK
jgi:hypothetical protein